ncbi:alcohol dehydrogenase catalytic domain-containing protein [Mycobacterium intracellulare]|uniref:quinone oxidoreductase family protein n=1 Tax=Mycobacterium intracellulare TaxID=1767 RepID=UPI001CDA7C9D|nr:alcohol dehydrogenase catalytic domain-containing protein [Mycobacterium intracellulare]MCA2256006.1 alcohol dehydrogenase catalytic domain-containing protein [Mycobacterium intracellulare]
MKAVRLFAHGGPEVLTYLDVPVPDVADCDVLIRIHYASINQWDLRYRAGKLPPNPLPGRPAWPLPFQLGRDGAGEVVAVGSAVTRWKVGDRVVQMPHPACGNCAMCIRGNDNLCINTAYPGHQIFGSYAQYVVRPQDAVLAVPDNVSYELAAATLWAYTTPLNCVTRRSPVGVGDSVVVTGASGGIAIACAQLAKLRGATVIGTTTKMQRTDELKSLGYDVILDSDDDEIAEKVRALTNGLGADATWDCVGGTAFLRLATSCTRVGGTVAIFGAPITDDGFELSVSALSFIFGELDVVGVRGGRRRDQQLCMQLLAQGHIHPKIDCVFPLADAADAHRYLENHQQIGKVLLTP